MNWRGNAALSICSYATSTVEQDCVMELGLFSKRRRFESFEFVLRRGITWEVAIFRHARCFSSVGVLPRKYLRRQFPIAPAFATAINKSRGQTFRHVSVLPPTPVPARGEVYVATWRAAHCDNLLGLEPTPTVPGRGIITRNVLFPEPLPG